MMTSSILPAPVGVQGCPGEMYPPQRDFAFKRDRSDLDFMSISSFQDVKRRKYFHNGSQKDYQDSNVNQKKRKVDCIDENVDLHDSKKLHIRPTDVNAVISLPSTSNLSLDNLYYLPNDICAGVMSMNGNIIDCNTNFSNIVGYPRENLLEHSMLSISGGNDRQRIFEAVSQIVSRKCDQVQFKTCIMTTRNTPVFLEIVLKPIEDDHCRIKGILWIGRPLPALISQPQRLLLKDQEDSSEMEL